MLTIGLKIIAVMLNVIGLALIALTIYNEFTDGTILNTALWGVGANIASIIIMLIVERITNIKERVNRKYSVEDDIIDVELV